MPLPVVLVEVAPPDAAVELRTALETACSEAVQRGTCSIGEPQRDVEPAAVAIVSWLGGERRSVRIQVGVRRAPRTEWLARRLEFQPEDAIVERWRAAGLVIATLVGELPIPELREQPVETEHQDWSLPQLAVRPQPARASRTHPRTAARPPARAEPPQAAQRWVEAGGLVGPGLQEGPVRLGGWIGVVQTLHGPLSARLDMSYALRPGESEQLAARWLAFHAGAALRLPAASKLEVWPRAALRLQRVALEAPHPITGAMDSASRWQPGIVAGLGGIWRANESFGVVAAVEAWSLPLGSTPVRVLGTEVAREPSWGAQIGVGAAIPLP